MIAPGLAPMRRVLLALLLAAAPALPFAAESPRRGSFELRLVPYHPNVDAEFGGDGPYALIFGNGKRLMLRGDLSWSIVADRGLGTVDVGVGSGYVQARSRAVLPGTTTRSGDPTALRIVPVALTLTYRLDQLANRTRWFPLAPYGRISVERYNWWATGGSGGVTGARGRHGSGATNGWALTGGVALALDAIDPKLGREMDNDTGINHVYLYAEAERARVDDFGSSKSWDLSPSSGVMYGFGLLFVF